MTTYAMVFFLSALLSAPVGASQAPPPPGPGDGPPSGTTQSMEQARDGARTAAMSALSSDHQAKVNAVIDQVKNGRLTDPRTAAQQIDAVLTPAEAKSVLAARDALVANMPGGPGSAPGSGPPGEPGGPSDAAGAGGPPPDGPRGGHRSMRNDAGFAMLMLALDRDQRRALFERSRPPQ